MKHSLQLLDGVIRVVASYAFRFILIIYALYIIINYDNYFAKAFYIVLSMLYFTCMLLLIGKYNKLSFLRLILDLVYIYITLFEKKIDDIVLASFILLPVVNATNHTGKKNPSMLMLCVMVLIFALHIHDFNFSFVVPILAFLIILFFDYYRQKIRNFNEYLTFVLDDFFNKNVSRVDLKSLLVEFILKLNNTNFTKIFSIESIYVFEKYENAILIKGSSDFNFDVKIDLSALVLKRLDGEDVIRDLREVRNKSIHAESNFVFQIVVENRKYIFLMYVSKGKFWFLYKYYILYIFKPRFHALINLAERDFRIRRLHIDLIKNMREKSTYVMNTISAMHFLRNRLSPIANYFLLISKGEAFAEGSSKAATLKRLIKEEERTANESLKNVVNRVNYILEKRNNPFTVAELTNVELVEVLDLVRSLWVDFLRDDNFYINLDTDNVSSCFLYSNFVGLEIVITDIISNISKHSVGNNAFIIESRENDVILTFRNAVNPSNKNINEFRTFISRFMTRDVYEVSSKSTGLSSLKAYLTQMNIYYDLSLDSNNNFLFVLHISKSNFTTI